MTRYEIQVKASTARDYADWFHELQVHTTGQDGKQSELLLTGDLPDQSALLGVLMRLHNLNLTILSVQKVKEEGTNHGNGNY